MNVDDGTTNSQTPTDPSANSTPTTDPTNPNPPLDPAATDPADPLIQGEPKPNDPPQQEEFVPLTVADITLPDGLEINEAIRDEALSIINNRELTAKEQLQGFVDLQARLANEASETISRTWEDTQKAWQDEVKADPTIGGDNLKASLSAVNRLVAEYGSDELVEAFALTGAGNNPHVVRFLHTVAGKLLEGGVVSATSPVNQESSAAERLFPSMKKG